MYTTHGHQIEGTPEEGHRPDVARCGGPGLCQTCSKESSAYLAAIGDPNSTAHRPKVASLAAQEVARQEAERSASPIMRYFVYDHLRDGVLRDTSKPFCELARNVDDRLPDGPEKSTALRKLLEAKDAAVRAALDIPEGE